MFRRDTKAGSPYWSDGLTEWTFQSHPDKREALFGPTTERKWEIALHEIAACSREMAPIDAVIVGLQATANELLEELRIPSIRRREILPCHIRGQLERDPRRSSVTGLRVNETD